MNKNLKLELVKQEIKQVQMSQDLSISPSRLSAIVNGWILPCITDQHRIAEYLNVSKNRLFKEKHNEKTK